MERRQMTMTANEAIDVPLAQQEWLSLCHSCETARDQHLAVEKQKIYSSQGLQLIDPLLMIDILSKGEWPFLLKFEHMQAVLLFYSFRATL